jgi:hypothetical protein
MPEVMEENHDRTRFKHDKIHINTWQNTQCWLKLLSFNIILQQIWLHISYFTYNRVQNIMIVLLLLLLLLLFLDFVGDTAIMMAR